MEAIDYTAMMPYACRIVPGLYFGPNACYNRRTKYTTNPYLVSGLNGPPPECQDCPGSIRRDEAPAIWEAARKDRENRMPKLVAVIVNHKTGAIGKPYRCEVCGETNPKAFRGKRKTACKRCESLQVSETKRKRQEEQETITKAGLKVKYRYECPKHGKHNGGKFGRYESHLCPECIRVKQSMAALKRTTK